MDIHSSFGVDPLRGDYYGKFRNSPRVLKKGDAAENISHILPQLPTPFALHSFNSIAFAGGAGPSVRPGVPPSGSAGCAPRPVPGRGHAASIPDASGRPDLRAALACFTPAGVVGLAC